MNIGILLHEFTQTDRPGLIAYICDAWREAGHRISLIRGIPQNLPSIDALIAHVNLTVVPPQYTDFFGQFGTVINRDITNISKRFVSRNLLARDDPWGGEVIVKTDRNFGGIPEKMIERASRGEPPLSSIVQRPWRKVEHVHPGDYPVFTHMSEVPTGVWRNPNLVVEKFIPERDGEMYCNRVSHMMGDKVLCRRVYSRSKVIKGSRIEWSEEVDLPDDFDEVRSGLGLDYGKIDFVVHNNRMHVLDVNKTPGRLGDEEIDARVGRKLASGLEKFIVSP